jgi:Flp pilus assembly protein TadD
MSNKKQKTKPQLAVPEQEVPGNSFNIDRALGLIVFVLAFLLYINIINHDYALDDVACIQQNKFTKQGFAGIPKMLTTFYWQGYWDQNSGVYRPLSMITFAIEYQFFKDNPHVSHFISVLLYALTAVLLFRVLRQLFLKYSVVLPFAITLLFVAHPLHTEVVANIKSRDELLCFVFFLLTLSNILNYFKTKLNKHLMWALVCYFLSIFSKEGALVYLGIIPLTLYFFTDADNKKIIRTTLQLGAVALALIAVHQYVISHGPPTHAYSYHDNALVAAPTIASRLATAVFILGYYLKLLFIPHPLSYDYSFNQFPATGFGNLFVLLSLAIHIGLLVYTYKSFKRKNIYAYVILFYFIGMSMVANVFMLIGATMADRLLYAPSLAFCIAVVWFILNYTKSELREKTFSSLSNFYKNYSKPLLIIIAIVAGFSFKTVTRNTDWQDNFSLFAKDVKASPGSSRTHYNYGTELMFRKAFNENDSLKKMQVLDEVITELETSAHIDSIDPGTYLNLSTACYQRKNYLRAAQTAALAVKYNPEDGKAYSTLGNSYYRMGNYDLAIENLKMAIAKGFGEQEAYNTIGVSYFGKKDYMNAIEAFKKSTEMNPKDITALNNLGSGYGLTGNYNMAIETFRKSYAVDPTNKTTVYYLALTYQNAKDTANARAFTQLYHKLNGGNK